MPEFIVCRGLARDYQGGQEVVLIYPPVDEALAKTIGSKALIGKMVDVENDKSTCTEVSLEDWKRTEGQDDTSKMAEGVTKVLTEDGHKVDYLSTVLNFDGHDDAQNLHMFVKALQEETKAKVA